MPNGRSFLITTAVLAIAGALALPTPQASAQNKHVALQLAWLPDSASTGEVVALKKGFFAARGLDVEILPGGPNANPVQEVLGGVAEIAIAYAPQIMYAANHGLPIKCFGAAFQKAPLTFYSLAESHITSIKNWKGKRVGAAQSAEPQIRAILEHNGLTMQDITFVQAQPPALLQGQIDIVGGWPTNVAQLKPVTSQPGGYNSQSIWDNGLQFQSNYYIAKTNSIENDTDTLVKFMEAVDEGWNYAADHRKEAIDMLVSVSPALKAATELPALKVTFDGGYIYNEDTKKFGFGNIDPARWQRTLDTYAKIGEIRPTFKTADVFDDRILKAAKRTMR